MTMPPIPTDLDKTILTDAANRLNSLSIHMMRRVSQATYGDEITPAGQSLLSVIVFGGPVTVSELARAENVSVPAVTRILDALKADGLAHREPSEYDRRAVNGLPTEAGLHVKKAARARRVQRIANELSFLTQEELEVVLKAEELLEESEARTQSKTL
ncbi:MAG: MarR family transcriptional regulator [Dehalococcoidia bacterium]